MIWIITMKKEMRKLDTILKAGEGHRGGLKPPTNSRSRNFPIVCLIRFESIMYQTKVRGIGNEFFLAPQLINNLLSNIDKISI
jgi:hypothetical protein